LWPFHVLQPKFAHLYFSSFYLSSKGEIFKSHILKQSYICVYMHIFFKIKKHI
jgi:hypothetical protein